MNPNDAIAPHEDNVVAYVLGELAGAELAAFERALATEPDLVAEVASAREVFAVLPAATAAAPPPALRERVLAAAMAAESADAPPIVAAIKSAARPIGVRRPGRAWLAAGLAAAAAVAVLVLGAENTRLRRELALQAEVNSTLQQPNVVQSFVMKGALAAKGAYGSVLLDLDAKRGAVALHRLPAPTEGKVYRLWAEVASAPVYCGDLALGEDGVVRNQLPIPVESYTSPVQRLFVTLEPVDAPHLPSGPTLVVSS